MEKVQKNTERRVQSPLQSAVGKQGKGTGRLLPTPPVGVLPQTVEQSCSVPVVELKEIDKDSTHAETLPEKSRDCATVSFDSGEDSKFTITYDAPKLTSKKIESQNNQTTPTPDMHSVRISEAAIARKENSQKTSTSRQSPLSGRSSASIDTAVLLQPTEVVLKALEQRSANKRNHANGISKTSPANKVVDNTTRRSPQVNDSDSDGSTHAIVGTKAKPPTAGRADRKSPNVSAGVTLTKGKPHITLKEPTRSGTFVKQTKNRVSPNVATEIDSDCDGTNTDIGCAYEGNISSMRNTTQTQTKVNRAFALRKDNSERIVEKDSFNFDTDRSLRSSSQTHAVSPLTLNKSEIESPGRDTYRTDFSLGQEIVKRSRVNARKSGLDSSQKSGCESDGERSNASSAQSSFGPVRQARSAESKPSGSSKTSSSNKIKSGSNTTGGGLLVSGQRPQTAKRNQTSPSPEYEAWRRRKDYNPQKSAAIGRIKGKTGASKNALQSGPPGAFSSSRSSVSSDGSGTYDDIRHDNGFGKVQHQSIVKGCSAFTHDLDLLTKGEYESTGIHRTEVI